MWEANLLGGGGVSRP